MQTASSGLFFIVYAPSEQHKKRLIIFKQITGKSLFIQLCEDIIIRRGKQQLKLMRKCVSIEQLFVRKERMMPMTKTEVTQQLLRGAAGGAYRRGGRWCRHWSDLAVQPGGGRAGIYYLAAA